MKKKKKVFGDFYPLLLACENNNIEMVQLLIDYANKINIILELNKKDSNGNYPLLWACNNNNIEMVQLIIDYANENNIVLEMLEMNEKKKHLEIIHFYWPVKIIILRWFNYLLIMPMKIILF